MNVLVFLIPISVTLGLAGLSAFVWTLRSGQFEDLEGDQARALSDRHDDAPASPVADVEVRIATTGVDRDI